MEEQIIMDIIFKFKYNKLWTLQKHFENITNGFCFTKILTRINNKIIIILILPYIKLSIVLIGGILLVLVGVTALLAKYNEYRDIK